MNINTHEPIVKKQQLYWNDLVLCQITTRRLRGGVFASLSKSGALSFSADFRDLNAYLLKEYTHVKYYYSDTQKAFVVEFLKGPMKDAYKIRRQNNILQVSGTPIQNRIPEIHRATRFPVSRIDIPSMNTPCYSISLRPLN